MIEGGDLVVEIGTLVRQGEPTGRYVVIYRRQGDGSLKLAVDVAIRGSRVHPLEWRQDFKPLRH